MKALNDAVAFARQCQEHQLDPKEYATLIRLIRRAFAAGVTYANTGTERASKADDRAGERVEQQAARMGMRVDWPGLIPTILCSVGGRLGFIPFLY